MKQLNIIKDLFNRASEIIVCCDAGREGELIHLYIYNYLDVLFLVGVCGCSLTDRAIRDGIQTLRPGSDYDNLFLSAQAAAVQTF